MVRRCIRCIPHTIVTGVLLIGCVYELQSFHRIFLSAQPSDRMAMYWALLALGLALVALSASSLFLKKPAPAQTALLALGVVSALYVFECALWLFDIDFGDRRGVYLTQLQRQGIPVDLRTPLQVAQDLRKRGTPALPFISPTEHLTNETPQTLFPVSGVARSLTVLCNESGRDILYTSDAHGYRNPPGLWERRPPLDVAIIGDSFAHGGCVEDGQDVASLIRQRFPTTINLGVGGTGPLIQWAIMREFLPALRPHVVLWLYYENDLGDLQTELGNPFLRQYLDPRYTQGLLMRQGEVDGFLTRRIATYLDRTPTAAPPSHTAQLLSRVRRTLTLARARTAFASFFRRPQVHASPAVMTTYAQVLGMANTLVRDGGGRLFLVFLPDWGRMRRRGDDPQYQQKDEVLAAAAKSGVAVIDVQQAFSKSPDPTGEFFDFPGSHYNRLGYQATASYILTSLADHP